MYEPKQPLAEVFGFLTTDLSPQATRYRTNRLCPFNNKVPNCTKDKAKDPLGVCSVFHGGTPTITCPIRFREDWLIADDAAAFFFPEETNWSSLTEVRLNDANSKSAGNIDVVLVAYDDRGKVFDFGALEIQAVYISGGPSTEARCSIRLSMPPRLVARVNNSTRAATAIAAAAPPCTWIDNMPPKSCIWRAATAWPGCVGSPG